MQGRDLVTGAKFECDLEGLVYFYTDEHCPRYITAVSLNELIEEG